MPVAEDQALNRIANAYAKLVAVGHLVAGAGLAWLAAWILGPLAHAIDGRSRGIVLLIPPLVVVALAVWFAVLGVRLWRRSPGWNSALRWTHAVVLAVAVLQLAGGWIAIRGSERSAAHGGGLLGGLGDLQVAAGAVLAAFALLSLPLTIVAGGSPGHVPGPPR